MFPKDNKKGTVYFLVNVKKRARGGKIARALMFKACH